MNKTAVDENYLDGLASSLANVQKGEKVEEIALSEITPDPNNPRKEKDKDSDQELVESILSKGIIQPIVVRPKDVTKKYIIIFGERRYRASLSAKVKTIPCIVRKVDEKNILSLQIIENIQRQDMNLIDEITALSLHALEFGVNETGRILGKKPNYITKCLRIHKADNSIIEFIKRGYSKDFVAYYELALLHAKYPDVANKIIAVWFSSPEKRTSLRKQIDDAKIKIKNSHSSNDNLDTKETVEELADSKGTQVNSQQGVSKNKIWVQSCPVIDVRCKELKNEISINYDFKNGETISVNLTMDQRDQLKKYL